MNLYIQCIVAGVLGVLFHIFAIKMPALKKRARAANLPFSASEYFKEDWMGIVSSLIAVAVFAWILDEVGKIHPKVMEYIKFFFVFVGYAGSSLLQVLLSNMDKNITKVVDKKTNIADNKNAGS